MCEECDKMEAMVPDSCRECPKFEDYHDCAACYVITKLIQVREMMDNGEDITGPIIAIQAAQLAALDNVASNRKHSHHVMTVISEAMKIVEPEITEYLGLEPAIYSADKSGTLRPVNERALEQDANGHNPQNFDEDIRERMVNLAERLGGLLVDNKGLPPLVNPSKNYLN